MDRFKLTKRAGIFGVIGNIFLLIIKAIVGFATKSQAMIADSFNSAGDIFSSMMTLIGNKIASRPSDDDHNLGHGKAEYIYSMLISIVIMGVGVKLLANSIKTFFTRNEFEFSYWLIVVSIITILVKFVLYRYAKKLAKSFNNLLIDANSKDHRNDCVITAFTLTSAILSKFGLYIFDSIVGVGISVWIAITGAKIFLESYDVLMDKAISDESKQKVLDIIETFPEIKKINHFNATPVGYKYQISCTIFVDGNMTTFESHEIANRLEKEIDKLDEIYLAVIHVNPI